MTDAEVWTTDSLVSLYEGSLRLNETRGVDRLAPSQVQDRVETEAEVVARKVAAGEYRFAPYAQVLHSKGPKKPPREICIPTARDRIALLALKERLHAAFPEHVGRVLPNSLVRDSLQALRAADPDDHVCLRLDIQDFYGSIDHDRLLRAVADRMPEFETLLVSRAVSNAAVPRGSRRSHVPRVRRKNGVPQGLAISNVLADLYLGDVDQRISAKCESYFRFVDDLFVVVERADADDAYELVKSELAALGLRTHPLEPRSSKGGKFALDERIEFLGYVFQGSEVSVRSTSQDRFLEKIAARLTRFRRERKRLIRDHEWMTPQLAEQVLIDEVNERISGAISESRRYGWMFYFAAMTDERVLFEMDAAISEMFTRLSGLKQTKASRLKRLARAFHEVKHRPRGNYVQDYDRYETMAERLNFLVERGRVGPDQFVSEEQVNDMFEKYRQQQLSELEADVAFLS